MRAMRAVFFTAGHKALGTRHQAGATSPSCKRGARSQPSSTQHHGRVHGSRQTVPSSSSPLRPPRPRARGRLRAGAKSSLLCCVSLAWHLSACLPWQCPPAFAREERGGERARRRAHSRGGWSAAARAGRSLAGCRNAAACHAGNLTRCAARAPCSRKRM